MFSGQLVAGVKGIKKKSRVSLHLTARGGTEWVVKEFLQLGYN